MQFVRFLRKCTVQKVKRMFFTDEKMFYLDPPVAVGTSCRFWSTGKKKNVTYRRLIRQRSKFSRSVMVSAGICFMGKGRLHFVPEKVNNSYYTEQLLPRLIDDCRQLMHDDFFFQQDGAPANASNRRRTGWSAIVLNLSTRTNGRRTHQISIHWISLSGELCWTSMASTHRSQKTTAELKIVLQQIWDSLSKEFIEKTILAFKKRAIACVRSDGGHFEHLLS